MGVTTAAEAEVYEAAKITRVCFINSTLAPLQLIELLVQRCPVGS